MIAVEPSEAMRGQLRAIVPDAEVLDGVADAIPLPDAGADALFVAEAFHWFATKEAVAELARVLRPGGGLALLWNVHVWQGDEPGVSAVADLITARRAPGVTREERYQSGAWREAFGGGELFEPFRRQQQGRNPCIPWHDHLQAGQRVNLGVRGKIFGSLNHPLCIRR